MSDNNYGIISTRFYRVAEWIWRMAYVNILWLGFSLLGLGIFGIFPATVALLSVLRKWLTGEPDISIFKQFWSSYKADFLKANILGYLLGVLGYIIWFNYQYLGTVTGTERIFILIGWYVAVVLFILLALFLFPVYVHFKMPLLHYFRTTIVIAISSPFALITLVIALYLALRLFLFVPGLIPFYSMSVTGWLMMWTSVQAFRRIDRKRERIENNEYSIKYFWQQIKKNFKSSDD
ncbi:YesL family protein [Amphibacillus xylanus]|uniref:DUF624 domain-containing protein n=1 Tax=Amphibacillus xylanus (strain ATCC 51415 / DSM 6626 / JCM 7361 / LMG 17667 / NBRC 15112 / Ep01) TaxID=698758 RepID=K0IVD1_AMPXN|nr:YesL family protein [Amphibacillus xylanus]BAM46399.1 hypothetical protein AXY_02670 [Amphibacillus xylanus NBRC 15112]